MRYFVLKSAASGRRAQFDPAWETEVAESGGACSKCEWRLPGARIGKVQLRTAPDNHALRVVPSRLDIRIVRTDLIDALGAAIFSCAEIGPLILPDGKEVSGYSFIVAEEQILLRGGPKSTIEGVCLACGRIYYWPLPYGVEDRYVLRRSLAEKKPLYRLHAGGLALREDIHQRVSSVGFKDIYLYELPIREEPEDGLPADLKPYLTPEEQAAMGDILFRDANKDRRTDYGGQWLPWKIQRNVINPKTNLGDSDKREA